MKQNILYVFGGEKASGAEIVIERLISHNRENVNPHLFISPGKFADHLITTGKNYPIITIERLKKLNRSSTGTFSFYGKAVVNYFYISYKVYKYIKKHQIDCVHANTIVPASYILPLIIVSKLLGLKTKWVWSDHDLVYFSNIDHYLSRKCASFYDATLVVSNAVMKKYSLKKNIYVLYNGLDLNDFKPDHALRKSFRMSKNIDSKNIVFCMAAIISPRKGQLGLMKVFAEIEKKIPGIQLLLAGSTASDTPAYTAEVLEFIKYNDKISYIGSVDKMLEFYNGCDIVISNSNLLESEPLGTTIYESMACEKIVVASDTGGTMEIIDNKLNGFLFEPGNMNALKQIMSYLIEHNELLTPIKKAAREKVEQKFNIEVMAYNYNKLLST